VEIIGTINMEFILPRVFGWPQDLFTSTRYLPKLAKWWAHLTSLPVFAAMRQSILDTWISAWDAGNFTLIAKEEDPAYQWSFRSNGRRLCGYFGLSRVPTAGKANGRIRLPRQRTLPMDGENVLVDTRIPEGNHARRPGARLLH
jgi:hypothetical protein